MGCVVVMLLWSVARVVGSDIKLLIVDWEAEDGVDVVDGYADSFVIDVNSFSAVSRPPGSPVQVDIKVATLDKSSKEVQVVSFSVHVAKDDTVFGTKGEYSGGGETMAGHVMVDIMGHWGLVVVVTIILLAEVGVFKGVLVGGVGSSTGIKGVVFESGPDRGVSIDECPEAGGGHEEEGDEVWSSKLRVFILFEVFSNSASNSGACKSSALTHES